MTVHLSQYQYQDNSEFPGEFFSHWSCATLPADSQNELWQVLASRIYNWLLDCNKLNILVNHLANLGYFVRIQGLHLLVHMLACHRTVSYHLCTMDGDGNVNAFVLWTKLFAVARWTKV